MAKRWIVMALTATLGCSSAKVNHEQAQVFLRLGTQQIIAGKFEQAFTFLKDAEKQDPQDPVIQNNLGLVYFARKDFASAESRFKKALELKPDYSDALNNLARVHVELTRYDEAISELDKVIKDLNYPTVEKAYVNSGIAYLRKGSTNTALTQFKKAVDANKKFCPAYNYYGQALFSLQKFDEALESFETALKLCSSGYDEARYYRALSYYKTGKAEQAEEDFEAIVRLSPGSEYAKKSEQMLHLVRVR